MKVIVVCGPGSREHPTGRDQMFRFKDVIYPVKTGEGYSGEIRRLTVLVGAW